jgi:antirestriction protein ArdC
MRDIYREVTEQIITELRNGVRPWIQPWSTTPGLNIPCNAVTERSYHGVNTLLLWIARHRRCPQPRFLTFKQALEAGGHVRKGERGRHVVFVKDLHPKKTEEEEEDNPRTIRILKTYTVFNVAQCDELPSTLTAPPKAPNPDRRDALIDEFIAATGAKIHEVSTETRAFYAPALDHIIVPAFGLFRGRSEYAAVVFHELVHWTAHPSRLDRQLDNRFGSKAAAAEELVAELGAAFLCAEFSIDGSVSHATYIQDYLKLLEDDPKAIFTTASKAQAAIDFLRQLILTETAAPTTVSDKQSSIREARHA